MSQEQLVPSEIDPLPLSTAVIARTPSPSPPPFSFNDSLKLLDDFRQIHRQTHPSHEHYSFPPDVPEGATSCLDPRHSQSQIIMAARNWYSADFRRQFIGHFAKEYPQYPDHLEALKITHELAPLLNQIFLIQMDHAHLPTPRSWYDDAPELTDKLFETTYQLFDLHSQFFQKYPENHDTLAIIANQLAFARSPEEFIEVNRRLEELALAAIPRGGPIIFALPTNFYTDPDDGSQKVKLAEAGLRVLFPFTGPDDLQMRQLVDHQSDLLHKMFVGVQNRNPSHLKIPLANSTALTGLGIPYYSSGDQTDWSHTSGEAFSYFPAFLYSPGLTKSYRLVDYSFQLAGITGTAADKIRSLILIYVAHELAHPFNNLPEGLGVIPLESTADTPALISAFTAYLQPPRQQPELVSQIPYQNFIAGLVGESFTLSTQAFSGNGFNDSYVASARNISYLLLKHQLIQVDPLGHGYSISPLSKSRKNIASLIKDAFHQTLEIFSAPHDLPQRLLQVDSHYPHQQADYQRLAKFFADFTS